MWALPLVSEDASSAPHPSYEYPIDLVHLARTTLGDANVEREMLAAFGLRTGRLMLRIKQAARSTVFEAAQALKSSAKAIGAWRVVSAAQAVELAVWSSVDQELESAVDRLGVAADETTAAIAELLQGN